MRQKSVKICVWDGISENIIKDSPSDIEHISPSAVAITESTALLHCCLFTTRIEEPDDESDDESDDLVELAVMHVETASGDTFILSLIHGFSYSGSPEEGDQEE